jgi:8-oxo-dGTP pyrophosphatase MutT (NUDIX family)
MLRHERLLGELREYWPADGLEADHLAAMVRLLRDGEDAFSRAHFTPGHITASCYIIDGDDRLLLHHHRRLGRWLQMGGHVEAGEFPSSAALREGREESGLSDLAPAGDGIFDLDVHAIPAGKGEPDHLHFDVRYLAQTSAPHAIARDANESDDLAWVTLDRAEELLAEEAGSRAIRKIRSVLCPRT